MQVVKLKQERKTGKHAIEQCARKKRFRVVDFSFHLKNLLLVTITRLTIGAWLLVSFWTLHSWKFDPYFGSEFTFRSNKPRASKYMSCQAQNSLRLKYLALWRNTDQTMEGKCTRCYQPIKAHLDTLSIKRADWNKRVRRQFSYSVQKPRRLHAQEGSSQPKFTWINYHAIKTTYCRLSIEVGYVEKGYANSYSLWTCVNTEYWIFMSQRVNESTS